MESELLVFVLGGVASYWPLYKLLSYFDLPTHSNRPAAKQLPASHRRFLAMLRREAAARAVAALEEAEAALGGGGSSAARTMEQATQRLDNASLLVASLFAEDARIAYGLAVASVLDRSGSDRQQASRNIQLAISAVLVAASTAQAETSGYALPPSPARLRPLKTALNRLGWMSRSHEQQRPTLSQLREGRSSA